jgi:hypothetical protein
MTTTLASTCKAEFLPVFSCWVSFADNEQDFKTLCEAYFEKPEGIPFNSKVQLGLTTYEDNKIIISTHPFISGEYTLAGYLEILVHETTHAVGAIADYIGEKQLSPEVNAYLHGYIFQLLLEWSGVVEPPEVEVTGTGKIFEAITITHVNWSLFPDKYVRAKCVNRPEGVFYIAELGGPWWAYGRTKSTTTYGDLPVKDGGWYYENRPEGALYNASL